MDKEKMDQDSCGACCGSHSCYRGYYGGVWYMALRWILLFVILLITFMFGVKMGELKSGMWGLDSYDRGGRGYNMMDRYYQGGGNLPPMMQNYYGNPVTPGTGQVQTPTK